jgi:hypothetical protein
VACSSRDWCRPLSLNCQPGELVSRLGGLVCLLFYYPTQARAHVQRCSHPHVAHDGDLRRGALQHHGLTARLCCTQCLRGASALLSWRIWTGLQRAQSQVACQPGKKPTYALVRREAHVLAGYNITKSDYSCNAARPAASTANMRTRKFSFDIPRLVRTKHVPEAGPRVWVHHLICHAEDWPSKK